MEQETTTKTITIKHNWKSQMHMLLVILENGNEEGKQEARNELYRLAEKLDKYNESLKTEDNA